MLFTSYEFAAFVTALFLLYYIVPKKIQWILLLLFNGIFIAAAGRKAAVVMAFMILNTYLFAAGISGIRAGNKTEKKQNKKKRWHILTVCLILNSGILVLFRYITDTMPLGLSYYGLMLMAYVIEVYRGNCTAEKNIFRLTAMASFFPALLQGPVSRYGELKQRMFTPHYFDSTQAAFGLERMLWGYFKKLVVADRILPAVQTIIEAPDIYTGIYVFYGMIFYAIQLYADFTGGIDITLGIARFLGIRLEENFNVPFSSKNLSEYWRRWHISLGEWIKDYVFYPMSVCRPVSKTAKMMKKKSFSMGRKFPVYISAVCAWFVTGLWHGREAHFIVWGLANCFVILVSRELKPFYDRFHRKYPVFHGTGRAAVIYQHFQAARTFLLVCVLRMSDCYQDVGLTVKMFFQMFTEFRLSDLQGSRLMELGISGADYSILISGILLMYIAGRIKKKQEIEEYLMKMPVLLRYALFLFLFFAILIFGVYGIGYDANQFIYQKV